MSWPLQERLEEAAAAGCYDGYAEQEQVHRPRRHTAEREGSCGGACTCDPTEESTVNTCKLN